MKEPTFENLKQEDGFNRELSRMRGKDVGFTVYYSPKYFNINPHLFKTYWWVFSHECTEEGWGFLTDKNRLCISDAVRLIDRLQDERRCHFVYVRRYPRREPKSPLDPNHANWKDAEWAPSFDEDTDEEWYGRK